MLVDSSALPEQVVHSVIADGVIHKLQGAAKELVAGNPAELTTDVRPVIDSQAFENIQKHIERLKSESKVLVAQVNTDRVATNTIANATSNLIAPHAFEAAPLLILLLRRANGGGEYDGSGGQCCVVS